MSENVPLDMYAQRRLTPNEDSNQPAFPAVWSGSSISVWRNFASLAIQNAPRVYSAQPAQMRRLIWIFAGRKCPQVRFLTLRFKYRWCKELFREITRVFLWQRNCVIRLYSFTLREQAYSNILKILPTTKWKFSDKNFDVFHISAQNIDCGYSLEPPRRGGSNEYPQFMSFFLAEIRNIPL